MSAPTAVDLRDVFCVHRTQQGDAAALQGLSLAVARGERVCVLGPSGAGKTTLLRVIAGLQKPSAGIARVFGNDIGRLSARAAARERNGAIGFLHQHAEAALWPDLSIARGVALPLALRGVTRAVRDARATELLTLAGLGDRLEALPAQLSGGERQRAAVCAAVAHRPRLLLADEPTAELDGAAAGVVTELIETLADRDGTTVITVTHDPALARRALRTIVIRDGRVVEDGAGSPDALVVGAGGWIRLGRGRLAQAGIGERVDVRVAGDGLLLTAAENGRDRPVQTLEGASEGAARPLAARPLAVQLRAVTRRRGHGADRRDVLDALTVGFAPGRMTAVVGRSGAGKTTLLELVACMDRPDGGELLLDGHPTGGLDDEALTAMRRSRIGYLPQEPAPIAFLTATENIVLALSARGWERQRAQARAAWGLDELGLADRRGQRVARLSAGEAQRVALARALACADGLLVVDEPTSRLDEGNAEAVGRLLASAAADGGHTVICATHDRAVIGHADEVVTLAGGW